jgi:PAS domain S-box-containing protein
MMNNPHPNGSPLANLVGKIGLHDHLCVIYETQQEQLSSALPFIRIGLERGEKCVYIADANTADNLISAMREHGINVDAAINQRRLTITNKSIYPHQNDFDPDRWIKIIEEVIRDSKSAGFLVLRLMGEMTWITGIDPRPERLIEFEAKFNHLAHNHDLLGICHYDGRVFQPEVILDILRTHPTVVYGGYICENPYYVPPDEFLHPRRAEREVHRMLARMRDDTANREKLRQSEERIRQSSEQHEKDTRALIDTIPQQIWSGPPDGTLDFANERWRSYMGLSLEELQGRGWQRMLHPDDRDRVLKAWHYSVANGTPYEEEERHRSAKGEYRWFLSRGVPMHDAEGRIVRWYGTNTDIEDRKKAEEEVRRLSGRLLQSQDEERRKMARDLHDSTGQDLVALETIIGQLQKLVPSSDRKSSLLLSDVKALADKCIREVRTLSFVLHPPALEQVGLIGALRDHVKGFSKRSGIEVELELSPHVGRMPRDVELALFRVVQEGLTNIQRHSGGRRAKIRIDRDSHLMLEIIDSAGRASDRLPSSTSGFPFQPGVGILSMQERVNLIGGRMEVDSTSGGTIVRVTIPLGEVSEKSSHSDS